MTVRLFPTKNSPRLAVYTLGGHNDAVKAVHFLSDGSLDCVSLSRNGMLCVWTSSVAPAKLYKNDESGESDEKLHYTRIGTHYYRGVVTSDHVYVSATAYSRKTKILAVALTNGLLCLHELPNFVEIQVFRLSSSATIIASTMAFNASSDWLAIGAQASGQLVIYDWQAKSYLMNQTGHYERMSCVDYSPDSAFLATGSQDGKVKIWNPATGFCTITFSEHTAAITGVAVAQSAKAVLSSSLDGTVRAFDVIRYRNFRTFTAPHPVQFSCLAVDPTSELVAAGSQDQFDAYVWAIGTGKVLEQLTGHEAPISSIGFGQSAGRNLLLATASWDKTLRIWDAFSPTQHAHETIRLGSDGLALSFRPDGAQVAVATLSCNILFYDPYEGAQTGCIEARNDLGRFRTDQDTVSGEKVSAGRAFTTLCYSADGAFLLIGGRSRYVCLYHVGERQLVRRFSISCNFSLGAMQVCFGSWIEVGFFIK